MAQAWDKKAKWSEGRKLQYSEKKKGESWAKRLLVYKKVSLKVLEEVKEFCSEQQDVVEAWWRVLKWNDASLIQLKSLLVHNKKEKCFFFLNGAVAVHHTSTLQQLRHQQGNKKN